MNSLGTLLDGVRLEHESEFKYFGCVWVNQAQMGQSVEGRWQVRGVSQIPIGL